VASREKEDTESTEELGFTERKRAQRVRGLAN